MGINSLKSEFANYLLKIGKITAQELKNSDDINVFEYANDYKRFLSAQDDIDVNRMGMSIETLVNSINDEDGDILNALESAKGDFENDEASDVIDMLGLLFKEDDVKASVDANSDDIIDKSEFVTFLSSISREDKDSRDITIRDILEGSKEIKSGHYKMPKVKDWEEISSKYIKETKESDEASSASGGGSVGGSGGSTNGGSVNGTTNNDTNTITNPIAEAQSNYKNLSVQELETKKTEQQTEFDKNNQALQEAIQGTAQQTADLKTAMDNSYSTFLDNCGLEETAKAEVLAQKDALHQTDIEANTASVDKMDKETQKQGVDMQIQSVSQSITSVDSLISSLKTEMSSLSSSNTADSTEGKENADKNDNQAKIAALQTQISQLEQEKATLEEQKAELEKESATLQEEITALEQKITELTTQHEQQQIALNQKEIELAKYSEAARQAYIDYGAAKVNYENANNQLRDTSLTNTQIARANIEAIENQLIIAKNNETINKTEQFAKDYEAGKYDTSAPSETTQETDKKPEEDEEENDK